MNNEYEICEKCILLRCAYEETGLTQSQQDDLCPVKPRQDGKHNGHLRMSPWRQGILRGIQDAIDKRGEPVPLVEFPDFLDVTRHTLYDWAAQGKYLETTKIKMPYAHWESVNIIHIMGVKFNEGDGH